MKKKFSVIFFSLALLFLFGSFSTKVGASRFWETIGSYEVVELGDWSKYHFEDLENDFNFSFDYSYQIEATIPIQDGYDKIYYFYGVNTAPSISYVDLPNPSLFIDKDDRFAVYRYDYATQDFKTTVTESNCAPSINSAGTCVLSGKGLYKIVTDGVFGTTPVIYLFYEPELYSMSVDSVEFFNFKIDRDYPSVEIKASIKDPRSVFDLGSCSVEFIEYKNDQTFEVEFSQIVDVTSCNIVGEDGEYDVEMMIDMTSLTKPVGNDVHLKVTVGTTTVGAEQIFNYDMSFPVVKDIKYYNAALDLEDFFKRYVEHTPLVLPGAESGVIAELTIFDDNELQLEELLINNNRCSFMDDLENIVTNDSGDYVIRCLIGSDMYENISTNGFKYEIYDVYGNKTTINQENIIFDYELISDDDNLADYVSLEDGIISVNLDPSTYSDVNKVCIFYGGDNWLDSPKYECGNTQIQSSYTYKGDIKVVVMDAANMFEILTFNNVNFTNSYDPEEFIKEYVMSLDDHVFEIIDDLELLIQAACGTLEDCRNEETSKFYAQIGDQERELIGLSVESLGDFDTGLYLSFLDLLNDKLRLATAANNVTNIQFKIIFEYPVGLTTQTVEMVYKLEDGMPNVIDSISLEDVKLEYKSFDITSVSIIQKLYGDGLEVTLKDKDNNTYRGKILSRFVSYKDREGNVVALNNEGYEYIATQDKFGYYTLECRVKLLKDLTNDDVYTDDIYVKSFFINVELMDTVIPTLTLLGEKEVSVKQYDVYKDLGSKCSDLSGCEVQVTYYLNSLDNQVEKIDTSVIGKYIIKYVAKDGDGNLSFTETRTVNVTGVNALDSNSIIIIASVVIVFALIVTFAIIIEVRKNKKRQNLG